MEEKDKLNEQTKKLKQPVEHAVPHNTTALKGEETKVYNIVHEDPSETYKREKAAKKARRRYFWLKVRTTIVVLLLVAMIAVGAVGLNIVNGMLKDAPELKVSDFISEESSRIYDDQGNMITEIGVYLRENITYDSCPESLVDAFLSIEDSRFFSHFGFDIPRFTKAAIENLKNHDFGQGGSTFTMQLVKNTYFTTDAGDSSVERKKSIDYKVQQIWLAIKLEQLLNKKEIFQLYMNRLNFGGHVRGVQKASLYYFGKDCNALNLPESAMLAGIINLPNGYNPYYYLDAATERRNEVLRMMNYHGYITEEEKILAQAVKVEDLLVGENRDIAEDSEYQSYIDAAIEEAQALTGADPSFRGMEIYTYLNQTIQSEIDAIQRDERDIPFPDELMQTAMIAMDNRNGAIVGIGGGRNYDGARLLNRATMNYKQPGSSVKPVLSYALAFEHLGYSMDEILIDKPITYPMESMVLVNATGKYAGDIKLKDAVAYSLNIPAILTLQRVVDKVGKEKVVSYMQNIGFSRITNDNFHLSFAIGGTWFETTVKELAGAHAMIINGGVYNEPHTVSKIVMTDGTEYYPQNQNKKVLSSGSAYLTCQLMENNVSGPYFNWMQILKRDYPVYAKTGTTDWGKDGLSYGIPEGAMKDKWMVSSTSHYTNAVWVGYDMAVADKQTYFTSAKERLQIPGNINKLLLDIEEATMNGDLPQGVQKPADVVESTYVYGSFPHVQVENWMPGGAGITSEVSKAGLESQPLVSAADYNKIRAEMESESSSFGLAATYDQYGNMTVSWGSNDSTCAGGSKNISLHDQWGNNIDEWGACIVDLNWLRGAEGKYYYAHVYTDGYEAGEIGSETGYFQGWVADLWGEVRVCGGVSGTEQNACTVAAYKPVAEPNWDNGWWDENGVFHENE
ncbi:MAG: transglycosylase domain-containing protein [Solobacterium sp.]|nr:transglycosylase domain-containing protein [Solobacterium sp.]